MTGILVLLVLSIHLLLTFKAKELLQTVVHNVSHGRYRLEAKKVDFRYAQPGIVASGIQLVPVTNHEKQGSLSIGKLDIELSSLMHLIFKKKIEVNHIKFANIQMEAYAKNKSGTEKKGIAETIQHIQNKLLQTIQSLNVKNLSITEAAIKVHTADVSRSDFLAFNHLDLELNDIVLERADAAQLPVFSMTGYLRIKQPQIHLYGSSTKLSLGELKATIADSSLSIDSLSLTTGANQKDPQNLVLSSLDIAGFHWNHFLTAGVLEFDSLIVKEGRADINLIKRKSDTSHSHKNQTYQGSSFLIHHTFISNIYYQLKTLKKGGKTPTPINMQLKGDSLILSNLSIMNGRQPAFDVQQLKVAIRNFEEADSMRQQRIGLSKLTIDKNNLVINNYQLETNKADTKRNYFRIAIPQFQLNNYSLEELLQKRLIASGMMLVQPDIMVDIRQVKQKDEKPKNNINETISRLMQSASQKVKLGEITIKDGDFVLLPTLNPKDQVKLTGLSLVIDASKIPNIRSAMDAIHAIKTLNSTGFNIVGKDISLAVKDMRLLNSPRGLYFGSIIGQFGKGKTVHLKGVTVLNDNLEFDPTQSEGLHVSDVTVDSGSVTILANAHEESKPHSKTPTPHITIDNLQLKSIVFKLNQGGRIGVSSALDLQATDFSLKEKKIYWSALQVMASQPGAAFEKTSFDAASMRIKQPGLIAIGKPAGKTSFAGGQIGFTADELLMEVGITSSDINRLQIESIKMKKPVLLIAMHKRLKSKPAETQPQKNNTDVSLGRLELVDPVFEFTVSDSAGLQVHKHQTFTGTLVLQQLKTMDGNKKPLITAAQINYHTDAPKSEINKRILNPSSLGFSASQFVFNPNAKILQFKVDSAYINQISQTIVGKKADTMNITIGQVGLKNYFFNIKDSLDWRKLIHSVSWWTKGIEVHYNTAQKLMHAYNVQARNYNGSVSFSLDSFAILPRQTRQQAWAASPYEKGYETIQGGKLNATGIKVSFAEKKPAVSLDKLYTQNLLFTTAKDKTKLEDTLDYRPLLTHTLLKIPIALFIDSVLLSNAYVQANEISKKTKKETTIFFTEVNGYLKNVKTSNIQPLDTLDMRIRARFYGTDVVRLHFRQSYYDSLQEFWMRVRMSHFNMTEMNKLLVPLMGLKIHTGTVDSLLLVAKGNDYFAFGTMDLRYHNLKAKLLKTDETKGKWLVSIANFATSIFLRKHDNGRTNLLYKERIRKRSIFNFWGKIALEGLLTNLGVKSDKKERRKFKKSLEALNLPDKYWQDEDND